MLWNNVTLISNCQVDCGWIFDNYVTNARQSLKVRPIVNIIIYLFTFLFFSFELHECVVLSNIRMNNDVYCILC